MIEVWRDGDRLLIAVPSVEAARQSANQPSAKSKMLHDKFSLPHRSLHSLQLELEKLMGGSGGDIAARTPRSGQGDDHTLADAGILAMTEVEWLAANLLALQSEAVALSRSLDETRGYVTEKCAAVEKV